MEPAEAGGVGYGAEAQGVDIGDGLAEEGEAQLGNGFKPPP